MPEVVRPDPLKHIAFWPRLEPCAAYEIAVPLTAEQKRKVEARARDEVRSVSSYVALLIVADLRQG